MNVGHQWLIWERESGAPDLAVRDFEQRVLPAVMERSSDAGLLADWSSNADPWLGSVQQLAYRAVLARALGLDDELHAIRAELRASPDLDAEYAEPILQRLADSGLGIDAM